MLHSITRIDYLQLRVKGIFSDAYILMTSTFCGIISDLLVVQPGWECIFCIVIVISIDFGITYHRAHDYDVKWTVIQWMIKKWVPSCLSEEFIFYMCLDKKNRLERSVLRCWSSDGMNAHKKCILWRLVFILLYSDLKEHVTDFYRVSSIALLRNSNPRLKCFGNGSIILYKITIWAQKAHFNDVKRC